MSGSKKFIQDRIVLLLITVNSFLATVSAASVILRLGTSTHSQGLIGEYRSNLGTFGGFRHGDIYTFASFIIFIVSVFIFHMVLARRVYYIRRQFALAVLGLGTLLILLAAIVSNSLLNI